MLEIGKEYKGIYGLKFVCVWRDGADDTFAMLCIDRSNIWFGDVVWVNGHDGRMCGFEMLRPFAPWCE